MNVETLKPRDLWDIVVRRKWLILAFISIGLAVAVALCAILPKSYRSKTVILVETQRIPERYVSPVIGGTVAERISMVQQLILSKTFLGTIAAQFKLHEPDATERQKDAVVEGLKRNIKIETKGGRTDARIESFTISFADSDPIRARDVTAMLANEVIQQNIKSRELLVEGTTRFLDEELKKATAALQEQEEAIAVFKRRYIGELPGQVEANLQTLSRLQREVTSTSDTLQDRLDRRHALQKMISSYEMMGATFPQNAGSGRLRNGDRTEPNVAVTATTRNSMLPGDPLATRLRDLERQLVTLSAEYKDTYPDVIQVKQEIKEVKARIAEKQAATVQPEPRDNALLEQPRVVTHMPARIDPYIYDLKRELDENEIGIKALKEQESRLKSQIRDYEHRVEKAPEREQGLLVLQRDYQNTRRNYESLLEKQLNARISENLEKHQAGETFRILDAADIPADPESPDYLKILLGGLLIGCGLGFGTAFAFEYMAGVVRHPEEAESLFGLPVLAAIPHFDFAYKRGVSHALPDPSGYRATEPRGRGTYPNGRVSGPKSEQDSSWKPLAVSSERNGPRGSYTTKHSSGSDSVRATLNLVAKWRPMSIVAEQYRVAATRLVLLCASQKNSIIAVTSSLMGEGKSSTASNLAYVLAQDLGKQTLLIDCDFKRPMLDAYTGVPSTPGLAEAIYGDAPLDACLHRYGETSMWVLPSGRRDHKLVDLTKIPQLNSILAELKSRFEFIILDAPPILPLADMNLLASVADMVLLIIRSGVTSLEIVQRSLKTLKPPSRSGIILTGYTDQAMPKYMQGLPALGPGAYLK